ncbi:MAG: GNAT family N-acetyltransferase [Gemmatimonadetes bacterium]|nr:GNAT family N-acetyltransferase [Gemmatimonadota bacterium]
MSAAVEVVVRHLVMRSPEAHRPSGRRADGIVVRCEPDATRGAVARECYHRVGARWSWTDRAHWEAEEWEALLAEREGEVWVAWAGDDLVGYAMLLRVDRDVEVQYFGLVPEWIGRGAGGWLLDRAVERAWALSPQRVRLETCTLDGPAALPNYLRRGFEVVREEHRMKDRVHGPG